ncbi:MAG: ABC transporter permease subunit [Actinomycetota bacterium]
MLRRYVLERMLAGIFGLLVFLTAVFFLAKLLIPGDITVNFRVGFSGNIDQVREALGLDQPLWKQYLVWLGGVFSLELGRNPGGPTVLSQVMRALPWTLAMFGIGIGSAFFVGSRIGRWAGWRKSTTTPTTIAAVGLTSLFPPWLVFLAFYFTLNTFGFRVFNRMTALNFDLWAQGRREDLTLWTMIAVTLAFLTVSALGRRLIKSPRLGRWWSWISIIAVPWGSYWAWSRLGIRDHALDLLGFLLLPVAVLFLLMVGDIILVVAASMDGLSSSDFALTARAKGLTDRQVREKHAGRVALLPALSRLTANLPFALGGLVIIEASFGRLGGYRIDVPGVASVLFGSLRQRNLLLTLGGLVVVGIITLLLRIGLDLAVATIDPRVQLERARVKFE